MAVAPFEVQGASAQKQVDGIMDLPETFPSTAAVMPRFEELVAPYRAADGSVEFPDGVNARELLQQATRDILTGMGLDVSGSDRRADERQPGLGAVSELLHDGSCRRMPRDHGRAAPGRRSQPVHLARQQLHVPAGGTPRCRSRAEPIEVDEPGSYKYFEALQQDYEQMPRQQLGLRNGRLDHMSLVKEEVVIALLPLGPRPLPGARV